MFIYMYTHLIFNYIYMIYIYIFFFCCPLMSSPFFTEKAGPGNALDAVAQLYQHHGSLVCVKKPGVPFQERWAPYTSYKWD